MNENSNFVVVLIVCALFLLGALAGHDFTKSYYRAKAVEYGAAEWHVDNHGKATFHWKAELVE